MALKDSRHQDLLRGSWKGEEGLAGLRLIMEIAGLLDTPIPRASDSSNEETETGVEDLASLQVRVLFITQQSPGFLNTLRDHR